MSCDAHRIVLGAMEKQGTFSGDLLVGNFGNGKINAYH